MSRNESKTHDPRRRQLIQAAGASLFISQLGWVRAASGKEGLGGSEAELILRNGLIATLDPKKPQASAVAIANGRFLAVGEEADVMRLAVTEAQRAFRFLEMGRDSETGRWRWVLPAQ
jgi:hypothetical protein